MTKEEADELLEKIDGQISTHGITADSEEGRRISYIPFSPEEDVNGAVRKQLEGDRDSIKLRAFGQAIQKVLDDSNITGKDVTAENVMERFGELTEEQQKEVLRTVVHKTPVILQHGLESQRHVVGSNDTVNIVGHGDDQVPRIFTTGRSSEDQTALKSDPVRYELGPKEILERMQGDLDGTMKKIKLGSCGSGGEFSKAFLKTAAEEGIDVDTEIHAYNEHAITFLKKEVALDNLKTHPGNRFVVSKADFKNAGELAKAVEAQVKILGELQEVVGERVKARSKATFKPVQIKLDKEIEKAQEAVQNQSKKIDWLRQKQNEIPFEVGKRAKDNKVVTSVREALKEQGGLTPSTHGQKVGSGLNQKL